MADVLADGDGEDVGTLLGETERLIAPLASRRSPEKCDLAVEFTNVSPSFRNQFAEGYDRRRGAARGDRKICALCSNNKLL